MLITDESWSGHWANTPYKTRPRDFSAAVNKLRRRTQSFSNCGTEEEPGSSLWMASLSNAMGANFREGMRVLDYGCGIGRYAHFLGQRLKRFDYFGIEKPGGASQHGETSVLAARRLFRRDPRAQFDLIGSHLEAEATAHVDVVVLGSIFTHVDLDEVKRILRKLRPVVGRGGKIVYSIFLADRAALEGPGAYGFADCYERAWFTVEQLTNLCNQNGWLAVEMDSFLAQEVNLHRIFALTEKP